MGNKNDMAPPKVLVVEDDQSITRMLRFSLKAAGFEIIEVVTGTEARNLLREEPPEAVVLDLGLLDGRGQVVLDLLRQHPIGPPAWIAISALDLQEATNQYGPLGQHFLAKPFDPWDLIEMLQKFLITQAEELRPHGKSIKGCPRCNWDLHGAVNQHPS